MKTIGHFIYTALICIAFLGFTACGSTSKASEKQSTTQTGSSSIENPDINITLEDQLRKLPGVQVSGSGPNADIKIRGTSTILGSSEPLFVVNGQVIEGGFRSVYSLTTVDNIKSIRVLKNASQTAIYGVRGANGVIEITMKR